VCELIIRVRNPYDIMIEDMKIFLSEYGLTFPPLNIEPNMEAVTSAIEFTPPRKIETEKDMIFINLIVSFNIYDQPRTQTTKLGIRIKRIFETELDKDLGAIFNDK
jgi:hypothetical protein